MPDGGVAFTDAAKFAAAMTPKVIIRRRMEREVIRAASLFSRCKDFAFHSPTLDEIFQRQVHNILGSITCELLLGIPIQVNALSGSSNPRRGRTAWSTVPSCVLIYLSHYIPGESIGLLAQALCLAGFQWKSPPSFSNVCAPGPT